jgi:hypothetical protein
MNDRERISRLVGAAISECASSRLAEVRDMLVRAMRRLGEAKEAKPETEAPAGPSFAGMTKEQRDAAVRAIDEMIDDEKSRSKPEVESEGRLLAG